MEQARAVEGGESSSGVAGMGGGGAVCAMNSDCDDGFSCTFDVCMMGACVNTPSNLACNDDVLAHDEQCSLQQWNCL